MDPTVTIAGVDRTDYVRAGSCRISKQLNGRASADLTLIDEDGAYKPALGNTVVIAKDGVTYFAGQIREIGTKVPPGTAALESTVRVLDYTSLLDRRLVSATYENMTLHAIVDAIITNCFGGDGITIANVENPGPTITEKLVFNYVTGAAALNQLSTITGYQYYIDAAKDLHFSQFTSNAAPFSLTDTSENWSDLEVSTSLNAYRNRQFVRTEHRISVTRNETFAGDDATSFFTLKYPCASMPTVLVDDVVAQVGNYGVLPEAGLYRWYWENAGVGRLWSCNPDGSMLPLASGSTLEVRYPAIWNNVAIVEDTTEVTARAAAEGDSGRWEAIREERNLDSIAALEAVGDGELRRNGSVPVQISFKTDTAGLEPGQRIPITHTLHGLNDDYLIESVDYELVASVCGDFFRHSVKCSNKEIFQSTGAGSGVAALASYMTRVADVARVGPTTTAESTGETGTATGGAGSQWWGEVPVGPYDASNKEFPLTYVPDPVECLLLHTNEGFQHPGRLFSVSGAKITFVTAPKVTDWVYAIYPHKGVTPWAIGESAPTLVRGLCGLMGAFTDSSGNVIKPVWIGKGPIGLAVPAGATQLQIGVNDDIFSDNAGIFTVTVNGVAHSVEATMMPWVFTGGINSAYDYGVKDGVGPLVIAVTAGSVVTVSATGTIATGNLAHPDADADGVSEDYSDIGTSGTYLPEHYIL